MDMFTDEIMQKISAVIKSKKFSITNIPWNPLPKPEDCEASAIDGGGGVVYLGPASLLYITRAVSVGKDFLKDSIVELASWESASFLEALRSFLELKIANSVTAETIFVDGSMTTMMMKWIELKVT